MGTPVIFVVGRLATPGTPEGEAKYRQDMFDHPQYSIKNFWGSRLPKNTPLLVTRWDVDVAAQIDAEFPRDQYPAVVIVGHSFGGSKAVEAAANLGRPCKLVLIDPVNHRGDGSRSYSTSGFVLSPNVTAGVCFFRRPVLRSPYPGCIAGVVGSGNWLTLAAVRNVPYVPRPGQSDDGHGEYVWRSESMDACKSLL